MPQCTSPSHSYHKRKRSNRLYPIRLPPRICRCSAQAAHQAGQALPCWPSAISRLATVQYQAETTLNPGSLMDLQSTQGLALINRRSDEQRELIVISLQNLPILHFLLDRTYLLWQQFTNLKHPTSCSSRPLEGNAMPEFRFIASEILRLAYCYFHFFK